MIGAIIGDIIGSTYEFIDNVEDKNFELFVPYSMATDDSIMSLAVGQALVNTSEPLMTEVVRFLSTI